MCEREEGTAPNMGDHIWPIRKVVLPLVRSANASRSRGNGISSPNASLPANPPKRSISKRAAVLHPFS